MSVTIALAGNPNSGKTTLFNALTGSNQFVGNWPGVTVEKKEGRLKGYRDVSLMDLPGIYSLSPYTLEEVVARNYLIQEKPDAVINIIDGTNLERNLYLTTQLIELGIPVIMAVNMMDLVNKNGDEIDTEKLGKVLGCDVVKISALKGDGIKELEKKAVEIAKKGKANPLEHHFGKDVEDAIEKTENMLESVPKEQRRFFAIKLLEKDEKIAEQIDHPVNLTDIIDSLEESFDDDTESIITSERYAYISSIIDGCYKKKNKQKLTVSDKIDKVVTNRILALPIFAVVMIIVYYISISTVGSFATDWANDGLFGDGWHLLGIGSSAYEQEAADYASENIWTDEVLLKLEEAQDADAAGASELMEAIDDEDFDAFAESYDEYGEALCEAGYDISYTVDMAMEEAPDTADYGVWVEGIPVLVEKAIDKAGSPQWLNSLIVDGIIAGVGAVLGFLPQMLILFIFLAFLESCGYMARVAFIMDRIFRRFGLSGKSFIPMLISSGCGVPGIMASRTIENDRDRKITIMTTTFIPCGAKMPIVAMIAAALFHNTWWVAPSAYFIGVAAIICSGIILKKTKLFEGDPAPFVMELPAYHMPTVGGVLRSMWERGWSFIKRAGTIILLASIVIWAGSVFGMEGGRFVFDVDMELESSVLGIIGGVLKWIFVPVGFSNVRATIATIMGLVAKEEVVGVFGVLDFEGMSSIAAYAFLCFNLLCAPCFAAMGAIRREMNSAKWFWIAIGYQTIFAYVVALCVYRIGLLISTGAFGVWTVVAFILVLAFIYLLFRPDKNAKAKNVRVKS